MKSRYTQLLKNKVRELGFEYCGISKAEFLEEEAPRLKQARNGTMGWMENHFDKRLDPRLLVEGAKSVVSLLLNYYPEKELDQSDYKVSKYAYGLDYHDVIKGKMKELVQYLQQEIGDIHGRAFVDSAPVMDKVWAKKGGLGWVGKNTNLINRETGSFFFIAELILDIELEYDGPIKDYCGSCTRCVDACPTDALNTPYVIDGSKCISYLTIELKENIPDEFRGKMENWIFGCDICQDVCPWNRFSKQHTHTAFVPKEDLVTMSNKDWEEITEEAFGLLFKGSAIKRSKYKGISRNITFVKKR